MTNVVPMYPEDEFWERVGREAMKRERLLDQATKEVTARQADRNWTKPMLLALWQAYGVPNWVVISIRHRFAELSRHA